MKTSNFLRLAALATAAMLVGAGCPTATPATPTYTTPPDNASSTGGTAQSPDVGFGKLPRPTMTGATSITAADGAPMATPAPEAMPMMAVGSSAGSAGMGIAMPPGARSAKPLPLPYPNPKPVSVEYTVSGTLPTWGNSGDVLQVERTLPDTDAASSFAQNAGLPPQALPSDAEVQSVSLQWNDTDGYQWTFDANGRTVSFWKNQTTAQPAQGNTAKPTYDDAAILNASNAFLDAHGFSAIRQSGGMVEDMQNFAIPEAAGATPAIYPCPIMVPDAVSGSGGSAGNAPMVESNGPSVGSSGSVSSVEVKPGIAFPPCGYYPQTVTVVYGSMREGKNVVDTNGNPFQEDSVTVSIDDDSVVGGNLQLEQDVDTSSYPLIDLATATKRLQSGGQNPVYQYGSEGGTIKVNLAKFDIVWMRYDAYEDNGNQTYYLPALLASGTVDRDIKGQAPEAYQTLVPLVADSAFEDTDDNGTTASPPPPVAIPMNGGAVEPMPAPDVAPAPAGR